MVSKGSFRMGNEDSNLMVSSLAGACSVSTYQILVLRDLGRVCDINTSCLLGLPLSAIATIVGSKESGLALGCLSNLHFVFCNCNLL